MKKSEYIGKPAIAVHAYSAFSGLEILAIEDGIDDYVVVRDWVHRYTKEGETKTEEIHKYKLKESTKGTYFRYRNNLRYYLKDFMRV